MVRMWFGVNGSGLDELFTLSVVSGLLFTTAMTSYRNIHMVWSFPSLDGALFHDSA